MGSSSLLDTFGDAVSQSGRSSRHHRTNSRRHKKRRSPSPSPSRSHSPSSSRSGSRSRSRTRGSGTFGGDGGHRKGNASRGSFFGLGGNNSRSGLFGSTSKVPSSPLGLTANTASLAGRPSYYKRSPREGFVQRCIKQLKRLLRDLQHYAKRHPWKVFFLVIVPLVTGGALTALLARFGLRIPPSIERMLGMASRAATGDPFSAVGDAVRMAGEYGHGNATGHAHARGARVERGRGGDPQWQRRAGHYEDRDQDGLVEGIRQGVSKMFS
ncbi:hypothetical protein Trco_005729 [Trichoderma cornu-damae]|uniref:Uncharacterized protein n=1 Tax=Trichoderma cornu-damae TaxID=654480 RepID=A0A9P8TSU8_9HYPO|nr:hypothetical protein Trco_005729 [Trichoderma cornu-damae]